MSHPRATNSYIFSKIIKTLNKKTPKNESSRHAKRTWKNRLRNFSFSKLVLWFAILFLFAPLFVITFFSFNEAKDQTFTGFSFIWYKKLFFDSAPLWNAFFNSFLIAFTSAFAATILGTLAAIGLNWNSFFGKKYIQTLAFLPMVLPEVVMGVSTLIFFSGLKIPLGRWTIFAAHTTFCLPFVYLLVGARIDEFDYSIVEAAHDLGATDSQTLFKVIVPAALPGILSGFLMSVTMSLEDYVITSLVSGPGSTTLPLYVYSMIRFGVSPVINSLSVIMILGTCLFAFILRKALKTVAASH